MILDLWRHKALVHGEGFDENFLLYILTEQNFELEGRINRLIGATKENSIRLEKVIESVNHDGVSMANIVESQTHIIINNLKLDKEVNKLTKSYENEAKPKKSEENSKGKPNPTKETNEPKSTRNVEKNENEWIVLDEYESKAEPDKDKTEQNVLWVGTSLSNQHLDAQKVSLKTNVKVKKVKAYTIVSKDGKYNPKLNVEDVVKQELEKKAYDVVIIETGVNEVSNLDLRKSSLLLQQEMKMKMEKLHLMTVQWTMLYPGLRVVLLERVKRIDSDLRAGQAKLADESMWSWWKANGRPENIILEKLELQTRNRDERDEVFGRLGERTMDGRFNDGIHLRGKYGSKEFTHRAVNMLRRVLRPNFKESRMNQETRKSKKADFRSQESRCLMERRRAEEMIRADERRVDDEWRRNDERSRADERKRKDDVRRIVETRRIKDDRKRAEEKRMNDEKQRRQSILRQREEQSKRRMRENKLRDEEKRRRDQRMRKSDENQKREMVSREDYEKRRVDREARHAARDDDEKGSEKNERRSSFKGKYLDNMRILNKPRGWREGREVRREGEWGTKYSSSRPLTRGDWRGSGMKEDMSGYYQTQYPPLPRSGNGRWGATAPWGRA